MNPSIRTSGLPSAKSPSQSPKSRPDAPRIVRVASLLVEIGNIPSPEFTLRLHRTAGRPAYAVWCTVGAWRLLDEPAEPDSPLAIRAYSPDEQLLQKADKLAQHNPDVAAALCAMHWAPAWRMCAEPLWMGALRSLDRQFPHFIEVILFLIDQLANHQMEPLAPFRIPPLLLCGPADVDKRRFTEALALVFGVEAVEFPMDRMTGPMLGGSRTGGPGWPVALFIGGSPDAVYLLEDLDKYPCDTHTDRDETLHSMLDAEAAATFTDKAVQVPVDLSAIRWVATCEDTAGIAPDLLSRFKVFTIEALEQGAAP